MDHGKLETQNIVFTKRIQGDLNNRICNSHLNCGNKIVRREACWGSGVAGRGESCWICQQCFGFWLSRYSFFHYVGALDKVDLYWLEYYDTIAETKILESLLIKA